MTTKPTVSNQRVVEERARKIFEGLIPDHWLIRGQNPDYHIDYVIEIVQEGELTGLRFDVQLKGTKHPRIKTAHVECSLKSKHLVYYNNDVREPVFLVLIDVRSQRGYWLFLQRWLREECPFPDWRTKGPVSVRIPLDQTLEDCDRLHQAVEKAELYMRELRPCSPEAALAAEAARLESLDPRVRVAMTVGPAGREIVVTPVETIRGSIEVAGLSAPEFSQRIGMLVRTGQTAGFKRGEVTIVGLPLLDSALRGEADWELTMESTRRLKADLLLFSEDNAGRRRRHGGATGEIALGVAGYHFEGQLADSPIWFRFTMTQESLKQNSLEMTVQTRVDDWVGERLTRLPGVDVVSGLSHAMVDARAFTIEGFAAGRYLFAASASVDQVASLLKSEGLDLVLRASRAARYLGINPVLPPAEEITRDDVRSIALLDELAERGEHRQTGAGVRVALSVRPFMNWEEDLEPRCRGLDVIFRGTGLPGLCLFDEDVSKTTFDLRLTSAALSYDPSELGNACRTDPAGFVRTVWQGQPGSAFMIRRSSLAWEEEPHVLIGMPRLAVDDPLEQETPQPR